MYVIRGSASTSKKKKKKREVKKQKVLPNVHPPFPTLKPNIIRHSLFIMKQFPYINYQGLFIFSIIMKAKDVTLKKEKI